MSAAFSKLTTLLELKHAASINDYVNLSLNSFDTCNHGDL